MIANMVSRLREISTTILNYKVNGFDKYFANILLKYPDTIAAAIVKFYPAVARRYF